MAKEIKTHHVNRNIKTLDKTVMAAEHMKRSYVRTKESVGQAQEQDSPDEYAQDKMAQGAGKIVRTSSEQMKKGTSQSRRAVHEIRERRQSAEEHKLPLSPSEIKPYQPKEQIIKQVQVGKKGLSGQQMLQKQTGDVSDRIAKTVKATGKAGHTIRSTGKGTIKTKGKSVKTAEQTSKTTVKTAERTAKKAQDSARRTAKAVSRNTQGAAQTAKQTTRVAKAVAKATGKTVKAAVSAAKTLIIAIAAGGWAAVLVLVILLLLGGFLGMTGGDNSETVTPVNEEVEAYEPLIRKYAKQYGMEEYVELVKAVMMQESGGAGKDPMQSSQGSFNTKYPKKTNGITDPEYSIECGIQELKNCLERAGVSSPVDMEPIKLALQGYNYGNGYIEWATNQYNGYSLANAAEFSEKMMKEKGMKSYGDRQYVPHVLRYYTLGRIPDGAGNQSLVQIALTQERNGGDLYWSWYGFTSRVSWCACFVSWCAEQCGYLAGGVLPKFSLCSDGVKWFQSKGRFQDGSYVPAAGDIIFFDWGNDGSIDHVGIVVSVKKGAVYTIEGNSGNMVRRQSYPIGDDRIYGYGVY